MHETLSLSLLGRIVFKGLIVALLVLPLSWNAAKAQQSCPAEAQFMVSVQSNSSLLFTATNPNISGATYTWDWTSASGNSGTGTGTQFTLSTTFPNAIWMTLTVSNDEGDWACQIYVPVSNTCSRADFTVVQNNCSATFTHTGAFFPDINYWFFGDGTSTTGDPVIHTYAQSGTYEVCHYAVDVNIELSTIGIVYCCKSITVNCLPGGDPGGTTMVMPDCCRLKVCFQSNNQNPAATHLWTFGDCSPSSTEANPCHYYDNVSTYPSPNGTPIVTVTHTVTVGGVSQTAVMIVNITDPIGGPAIYVGQPDVNTDVTVLSCVNGQPLFPQNNVYPLDPVTQIPGLQGPAPAGLGNWRVHVSGRLRINIPYAFFNGVNFCIDPCSGITIPSGQDLALDNNVLLTNRPGCQMWESVDLMGGFSSLLSQTNVTVQNSMYGFRVRELNSSLNLFDTRFRQNFIGMTILRDVALLRFDKNSFSAELNLDLPCPLIFAPMPPPIPLPFGFRGMAGIFVDRNALFNIPVNTNTTMDNFFSHLENGIYLQNSNANIRRCRFNHISNIVYDANNGGNGIRFVDNEGGHSLREWGNNNGVNSIQDFNSVNTGVSVRSAAGTANTLVQSENNRMTGMERGYFLDILGNLAAGSYVQNNDIGATERGVDAQFFNSDNGASHLDIEDNIIGMGGTGAVGASLSDNTFPFPSTQSTIQDVAVTDNNITLKPGLMGVLAFDFRNATISGNTVHLLANPDLDFGIHLRGGRQNFVNCLNHVIDEDLGSGGVSHGIVTEQSRDNNIADNQFENTIVGIQFREMCGTNTILRCNVMNSNEIGLDYWDSARTGAQISRGNSWEGNWPGYPQSVGARHLGDNTFVSFSTYKANMASSQFPPSIETPNSNITWFSNGSLANCVSAPCEPESLHADNLTKADSTTVTPGFDLSGDNDAAYNWSSKYYLYERLATNSSLAPTSNTLMQNFKNAQATQSLGQLHSIANQVRGLMTLSSSDASTLQTNFNSIQSDVDQINAIDAQLAAGVSASQQETLMTQRQGFANTIESAHQSNNTIRSNWMAARTSGAASIISSNNAIATSGLYDANEKKLHQYYLHSAVKGLPLTLVQKADIKSMALQCFRDGGDAVYRAGAWHEMLTGEVLFPQGCPGMEERSKGELPAARPLMLNKLDLSPNPASNLLNVNYSIENGNADAWISILDARGVLLTQHKIDPKAGSMALSTSGLANGLYLVQLSVDNLPVLTEKLLIQH